MLQCSVSWVCRSVFLALDDTAAARGAPRHDQRRDGWGLDDVNQGVNVLYRGYVQLTNTKNSKTNVYTFVLHRARLKSIMHP